VQQGTTGENSPIINSPITIGNIPKDISSQDMTAIVTFLSSAPAKTRVAVATDQVSGNASVPGKFYDALKAAGWPMVGEGVTPMIAFGPPGKGFQGAVITIKGEPLKPNETISVSANDPTAYIGKVLDALKIPRILLRVPDQPDDQISITFEGGFPN
jgi:hypothetical protein